MENLLYLVHRIPYPPNKGDKIRSFHWLEGLARHFNIYLATFIDDPEDIQYSNQLDKYCVDKLVRPLSPTLSKIKSLRGLVTGQALSLPYYHDKKLHEWVAATCNKHNIKRVLIYSSTMAQYIDSAQYEDFHRVIDFIDIDSDKWRQYATTKSGVAKFIYQREAEKLFSYESAIAQKTDYSFFVSGAEAKLFRQLTSLADNRVGYMNNGVNAEYFSPEREYPAIFPPGRKRLVFTGAMDYWANIDAVVWFAEQVFPELKRHQDIDFYIVGSKPGKDVQRLHGDGICVTGRVDDVRPYIFHSDVVVAPMRIARGVQNKVLEGMAMAKPVVVSPAALEGIQATVGDEIVLVEQVNEYVKAILDLLNSDRGVEIGMRARQRVVEDYSWQSNVDALIQVMN